MFDRKTFAEQYWACVAAQDRERLPQYFLSDAEVFWHCTNERFTVDAFVRVNCEYPGQWSGEVERVTGDEKQLVTVAHIWTLGASFHVCAFMQLEHEKIRRLDEYWADDGPAPAWRQELRIGRPIHRRQGGE